MIKVTLRDDVKEFESGITVAEIAKSIGMGSTRRLSAAELTENIVTCELP